MLSRACVFLGASVCVAVIGCGERPLEPRDPTPGVPHYVFKSYNVEVGDQDDPATVTAVGAGNADVVCLQETTPEWEDVIRSTYSDQYPYQLYNHNLPDAGAGGLAVLSKFPITDGGWQPGPNGWHPAWHLNVDTPAGRIQILNLHLRAAHDGNGNAVSSYLSSSDDHVFEIKQFMSLAPSDAPSLVIGDFNEGVEGAAIGYLEARGFRNALPLYHPGQFTWKHASVANQFSQTLDHILFDGSFAPLNAWVMDIGASDHIPVMAHLEAAHEWYPGLEPQRAGPSTRN